MEYLDGDFRDGDVVSLSRGQTSAIEVTVESADPDQVFWVDLTYQERTHRFEWTAAGGETPEQIAAALEAVIFERQTYLESRLDIDRIELVSPFGESFDGETSAGLALVLVLSPTRFEWDGRTITRCRVLESNNTNGAMRIFWTRFPPVGANPGEVLRVQRLTVRELNRSTILDINANQVAVLVSRG